MTTTTPPRSGNTTYHRDGTVTIWDCLRAQWVRGCDMSDDLKATLSWEEREKVERHTA